MSKSPPDWTDLVSVIQYAETLGPGYTVFKDKGSPNYGICPTKGIPEEGQKKGTYIVRGSVYNTFCRRFIIFQTREKK